MKLSVYKEIVELLRSLRWTEFAIQNVAEKYPQYVLHGASCIILVCGYRFVCRLGWILSAV